MNDRRFHLIVANALLFLGIALLLLSIVAWFRFKVSIPINDSMQILPLVETSLTDGFGNVPLQEWLKPISDNTHRIVISRFLMLLDYAFFGGANYAIYASAWLSILLLVFVYIKAAGLDDSMDRAGFYFVSGIALIYLCSPTQLLNLVNPINASWYVAFATSAASMLIILSAGNRLGFAWMLFACLLAAIAAFSNFAGVVTCLVLPVIALHQRSILSVLVSIFCVVLVLFYLQGVEAGPSTAAGSDIPVRITGAGTTAIERFIAQLESPALWPALLDKLVNFVALQLGAPLSAKYPHVAAVAVLGSVLLIGYQWLLLVYRWCLGREPGPRSMEFCLAMATICLGISCATVLGRMVFTKPLSVRYQTITMLYWLSISCLIFCTAQTLKNKRELKSALVLIACLPTVAIIGSLDFAMSPVASLNNQGNAAQILGQMGANWFEGGTKPTSRFYAPYFANHMDFLANYGFAAFDDRQSIQQGVKVEQSICDGFTLDVSVSKWPGVQEVRLRPRRISSNPFFTRMRLYGNNGEAGILYPHTLWHYGRHNLREVFFDKRGWRGFYRGDVSESMPITLFFKPLFLRGYKCILMDHGRPPDNGPGN